jgi:Protein of unknown function (DUF2934)
MASQERALKKKDPVLSDQGGRVMQLDPTDSTNARKEDTIRRKAYEIYERRGRSDGHDLEDWLKAEQSA